MRFAWSVLLTDSVNGGAPGAGATHEEGETTVHRRRGEDGGGKSGERSTLRRCPLATPECTQLPASSHSGAVCSGGGGGVAAWWCRGDVRASGAGQ